MKFLNKLLVKVIIYFKNIDELFHNKIDEIQNRVLQENGMTLEKYEASYNARASQVR